ncbi:zinc finger CCCH domain-containing protein 24 [Iris pallida]|uniref:Zinc finger CCCH domain-containing protein 24 n=1 Tax=Iris pallida TaxID=29817 RepID=A0AAX6FZ96_IRIPA|nr:zinc finger CCCH domain-containing protein 24 [Iris pallida]
MEVDPTTHLNEEEEEEVQPPPVSQRTDGGMFSSVEQQVSEEKRKRSEEEEERADSCGKPPLWKTSLCTLFTRGGGGGRCSYGEACRYAHGEAELRPRLRPHNNKKEKRSRPNNGVGTEAKEDDDDANTEALLDKCLIGLSKRWVTDDLNKFLQAQGIQYKAAKKKKGMNVGFVVFEDAEQVQSAIEVLNEKSTNGKQIKVADTIHRSYEKKQHTAIINETYQGNEDNSAEDNDDTGKDNSAAKRLGPKTRSVCDVVTPFAHMPYNDQLEHKKSSLSQMLKRLTRNTRKACPDDVPLPEWILKSRDIGGLPCKLEGILESPLIAGYRNKCEFSVGHSVKGKRTVGFMLGNFREGMTAVEEPVDCPNISRISCQYARIFQDFLESSEFPIWNRVDNTGFWRQFTVREGRSPGQSAIAQNADAAIAEVMLIVQVCSVNFDEELMKNEFKRMAQDLAQRAASSLPPLPLTKIVVQDHKGISNAAPADCPLLTLPIPNIGHSAVEESITAEARIHDYISNLCFSISPTSFFQVNTLAAERLYTLAGDWAELSSNTLLFDVCCGTGTIGLSLAHRVGMVIGIEMNVSAVSDAIRNAESNGIKNYKFVCGKAEDVMGAILEEYLGVPQEHNAASEDAGVYSIDINATACTNVKSEKLLQPDAGVSYDDLAAKTRSKEKLVCKPASEQNADCRNMMSQDKCVSSDTQGFDVASAEQFKDVVAIVDPPRVGLHPIVIKALRTHPRIRRLVYISCNPESLVANAIELCTPTSDTVERGKGNRGWRKMSCAGLARQRTKNMPSSEPFRPVRAMAVDLFPHTPHCEMVMLLER